MHDHVAVIEQDPARIRGSFAVSRLATEFLQDLVPEVLQDSGGLSLTSGGADHKVVSDQRDAADVEEEDVAGLLIGGEIDDPSRQTQRFFSIL